MSVYRSLSSRIHPHDRSYCDANRLSGMRSISCRCCLKSYIMISIDAIALLFGGNRGQGVSFGTDPAHSIVTILRQGAVKDLLHLMPYRTERPGGSHVQLGIQGSG